jgi:hypothetical protein
VRVCLQILNFVHFAVDIHFKTLIFAREYEVTRRSNDLQDSLQVSFN